MATTVNLSVSTESDYEDFDKVIQSALESEFADIGIEADIKISRRGSRNGYTKGQHIYDIITESVAAGNYITRGVIAETANATVSRVSEVLREMEESEDESIVAIQDGYRALAKADRKARRYAKQLEDAEKRKAKAEARITGATSKNENVSNDPNIDDN